MTKPRFKYKPTINIKAIEESWTWQYKAACRDLNDEQKQDFYYEDQERGPNKDNRVARAKAICDGCEVKQTCLEFALSINEGYGIWGGLTPEERYTIKRRRQRQKANQ